MNYFVSNLDDPLGFFKSCLIYDSYGFLLEKFRSYDPDNDHIYNPNDDTVIYYSYSDLEEGIGYFEDGHAIPNEIVLTFDQYINKEFLDQVHLSQSLIFEKSKSNGYDQDLKLYNRLLTDLTNLQKGIDKSFDLNFKDELTSGIHQILKYTLKLFSRTYPNIPANRLAKTYFTGDRNSNITGFKLKYQDRRFPIDVFIERLFLHTFVTKTSPRYIKQFLQGEVPDEKINWNKDQHELKFFIDKLYDSAILESKPSQQWRYITQIFTWQGEELPKNWHRNHNKLKNQEKRQAIIDLCSMLLPRR